VTPAHADSTLSDGYPTSSDVDEHADGEFDADDTADEEFDPDLAAPPSARAVPAPRLDGRSREILAFERRWWRHAGAKEQAIRDTFGLSSTRYYQLLNALLDNPAALAHDPVLVGRLRRLRAWRSRSRPGRG
jgi:hypothetical protein